MSDKAFEKIVALINASEKSEKAVRERLLKQGFSSEEVDDAVHRAKDYAIIDDARFASLLIRSRMAQGKGKAGIQRELAKNGIDPDTIEIEEDETFDADTEIERALQVLERKPPRSKNLREGAYRKLMQKGYSSYVASAAARQWFDSLGEAL